MKKSKILALSAMTAALGTAILFVGGLLGVMDISAACIVSFLILFCYVETGPVYALMTYAAISLLSFLICGDNLFAPVCFAFFFGPMAVTKFLFEKTGKVLCWIFKLTLPAGLLALGWLIFGSLLDLPDKPILVAVYYGAFMIIAFLTQLLYTAMVRRYFLYWRDKISKYLK